MSSHHSKRHGAAARGPASAARRSGPFRFVAIAFLALTVLALAAPRQLVTPAGAQGPSGTPRPAASPSATPTARPSGTPAATPSGTAAANGPRVSILVKFRASASAADRDNSVRAAGGETVREFAQIRTRQVSVPANAVDSVVQAFSRQASVERAAKTTTLTRAGAPNDPGYSQQWALPKIGWDQAYGNSSISGTATIAVLDSGVDASHPDLAGRIVAGQSFVNGNPNSDPTGHGTAVAGIAAASVNNSAGIAGVAYAGASLSSVQVLGSDGTGTDAEVVAGVLWAADNGADVILMPFSSPDRSDALADALAYAWGTKGAVLVAATGNNGSTAASYPAGLPNVLGVAATDQNDAVGANSNTGSAAVAAPGVGIYTTQAGGGYGSAGGTSAASAHVAGLAALLVADGRSNSQAFNQIRGATDPVSGRSFGRINVARALGAAVMPSPTPTPTATPASSPTPTPSSSPSPTPVPTYTAASNVDVSGRVVVAGSNPAVGIAGATVSCTTMSGCNSNFTTTTDNNGNYSFIGSNHLTFGGGSADITLNASKSGYVSGSITLRVSNGQTLTGKDISLTASVASTSLAVAATTGTYGGTTSLSATLTSAGNPVSGKTISFTLNGNSVGTGTTNASGMVSLSGVSLSGINAGTYPVGANSGVAASFAGDSGHAASSGSNTLTVNKATLTVTANDKSRTYGLANPTLDATITGFVSGETETGLRNATPAALIGAPSCSTAATATSAPGAYDIVCTVGTLTATNYGFSFEKGTLTVGKANQVITFAQPASAQSFGATFNVNPTASSGLAVSLSATGGCTSTAAIAPATGFDITMTSGTTACSLTASQAGDANYNAAMSVVREVAASKASQAITFGALTGKTYGDADFQVSATGGASGNPVTFAAKSGSSCTVMGDIVHITGTGTCTVVASQAGNDNYEAATLVEQSFTVAKAVLTVKADDKTRTYGAANPSFSYTVSGFKNGETASVVTGSAACGSTATASSSVGTYPINCQVGTLSATNYNFTFAAGTLTIDKAAASVTPNAASKTYGDADPAFTGMLSGFLASDNVTSTYSRTAGESVAGSPYTISATLSPAGVLGNYTITYNTASFTITKRPASWTTNPSSKTYGDADPSPLTTGGGTGFLMSDGVTASYSRTAGESVSGSPYHITATLSATVMGALDNYTIENPGAAFTISKAELSVTAANASRQYGDPNPAFTGMISGIKNSDNITATYSTTATAASAIGAYPIVPTLTGVPTGVLDNYTVMSHNGTLTITTRPITVTADAKTKIYGDADPDLTYQVSSGSLVGSDSFTGAPSRMAGENVGEYDIQQGTLTLNSNYALTFVGAKLTVNKAPLTISAADKARVYGDDNPELTGAIVGLKNNDAITATYSTTATVTSNVGTYTIVPAPADATPPKLNNYEVTIVNGTLTITARPLTVTADNKSKTYDGSVFTAFTATYAGLITADANADGSPKAGVFTAPVSFGGAAAGAVNAGSYAIVPSNAVAPNYSITFVNGTLTINKATPTVSVTGGIFTYNGQPHAATGSVTGVGGANLGTPSFSYTPGGNDAPVNAGSYDVIGSFAGNDNYNPASGMAMITINKATPTVNWSNPANINEGTALGAAQLNATVSFGGGSVNGDYSYTPAAGTVPLVGTHTLKVEFTPTGADATNFNPVSKEVTITVVNVPPTVAAITAPLDPVAKSNPVTISTSFTDPGGMAGGQYTVAINWGDISSAQISAASTPGQITASHTYLTPGVYTITVTVTDKHGGSDSETTAQYVVVYDPNGGFVTGGGWLTSPVGACQLTLVCAGATGRANFGFVSKYARGANVPTGETEFQFKAGNLNFHSTAYEWLVISGARAQYKGSGTINGSGNYGFLLTAIDGAVNGGGGTDKFRIKIWDKNNGDRVVYDNQMDATDDANPTTVIGGGSIVIHNR